MAFFKIIFTTFSVLIFVIGTSAAAGKYKFSKMNYVVKSAQGLEEVYQELLKDNTSSKLKDYLIKKTKQINRKISNWDELKTGQKFKLLVERKAVDRKKYAAYKAKSIEKKSKLVLRKNPNLSLGVLVAASAGTLNQANTSDDEITFSQNSPLTLGFNGSFRFNEKLFLTASAYGSYFLPAENKYSNKEIGIPLELGATSHLGLTFAQNQSLFAGIDFERLSIFNSVSVSEGSEVVIDQVNLAYLTVAYQYDFMLKHATVSTKLSGSYSMFSQIDYTKSAYDDGQNYSAYKMMLSSFITFDSPWYTMLFFKYHAITDETVISFTRYGAGVGYRF